MTQSNDKRIERESYLEMVSDRARLGFKTIFRNLKDFLSPDSFSHFVDRWVDREFHGRVPTSKRSGYLFRTPDLYDIAPGLFDPALARLEDSDLPEFNPLAIEEFLKDLIARSRNIALAPDIATAIGVATEKLGITLSDQARDLHELGQNNLPLYRYLMKGDFVAAGKYYDLAAHDLFVACAGITAARQRIIWNCFDLHRTAGRGSNAAKYHVAWFLRPLMKSWKANELLLVLLKLPQTIRLMFEKQDIQLKYDPSAEKIAMGGNRGLFFTTARAIGEPIERLLGKREKENVHASRESVRIAAAAYEKKLEQIRTDPARNNQESIHEHVYGLSEIATLFIAAHRFAEDEAVMMEVIAGRAPVSAVWDIEPRPLPSQINATLAARARHLVAAYRSSVLRDQMATKYNRDEVRLAETSEQNAWSFLTQLSNQGIPNDPTGTVARQLAIAKLFDLSHTARVE